MKSGSNDGELDPIHICIVDVLNGSIKSCVFGANSSASQQFSTTFHSASCFNLGNAQVINSFTHNWFYNKELYQSTKH